MTQLLNDYTTLYDHVTDNNFTIPIRRMEPQVQPPLRHYNPMLPPNLPTLRQPVPQLTQPQIPPILTLSAIPTLIHQQDTLLPILQLLTAQLDPSQLQLDYYAHTFNTLRQLHPPLHSNYRWFTLGRTQITHMHQGQTHPIRTSKIQG